MQKKIEKQAKQIEEQKHLIQELENLYKQQQCNVVDLKQVESYLKNSKQELERQLELHR